MTYVVAYIGFDLTSNFVCTKCHCFVSSALLFLKNFFFFKTKKVYSTEQKAFIIESYFRNGRKVNDG
jgi:hypothetical protein